LHRILPPALALLVAALAVSLLAHAAAGGRVIAVRYPVAVVLYDPGGVLGGLDGRHAAVNVSLEVGGYRLVYVFNVILGRRAGPLRSSPSGSASTGWRRPPPPGPGAAPA